MKKILKTTVFAVIAFFAFAVLAAAAHAETVSVEKKPIPSFLFGQNIEHTRSAVQGGLSAQLVKNRKFAGKPSREGVLMMWEPYGTRAFYQHATFSCTRHAARSRMWRQNEHGSQVIGSLESNGEAGICQGNIGIRGGVAHTFKAVVSTMHPVDSTMVLRVADADGNVLAEREFTVNTKDVRTWTRISLDLTVEKDTMAKIFVGVKGKAYCAVGAVSLMPADNFHGMRADVVENLRDIGTSIVRWPGGNFAGEYRWRDGLIEDPDERAPLQSYTEIETQPHSLGYDSNDIGMEDVIALCGKIGAEPFFTINAYWESPQDSVDWVKACKGRVKLWSLGNEMGHAHMEGPKSPEGYTAMVRPHAEAMLKEDPSLKIIASGHYPSNDSWIQNSAVPISDIAPVISYHRYDHWSAMYDYSTPETTAALFNTVSQSADHAISRLKDFRGRVPANIKISYDEWNLWYAWYRKEGIVEGLYAAKMLNGLMRNWEECGLEYVCYFQAVNEQAINVGPFESHLTSVGEAMRLWKGHVDGIPVNVPELADGFVTDAKDGSRYMTCYNFSTTESKTFRIPTNGRGKAALAEALVPNGLESGCRYSREKCEVKFDGDFCEVTLGPACQAAVRLVP